jgi:hypothetical protein
VAKQDSTGIKPGDGTTDAKAWRLVAKHGRDGKEGKQGPAGKDGRDGINGRDGKDLTHVYR